MSNQPQYSALWRVIEGEVIPLCEKERRLADRLVPDRAGRPDRQVPARDAAPPEGSRATDDQGGANMIKSLMREDVLTNVQELKPLAADAGLSMAQLAVGWVLSNPNVASAIVGASRPEQVRDNAAAKALPADLKQAVDDVLAGVAETDPSKGGSPPKRP